ncbi:MAG: protocatechuate 3,4-dioxygenase subunit alpha [Candidatus Acidiferrum sp.]|jgi:protocatechuate 3,4-dioxygenase alpha subunit
MKLIPTGWQTVGPFFSIGLDRLCNENIAVGKFEGERIAIAGRVLDGDGAPVPDALLEIWQADARGIYPGCHSSYHEASSHNATGNAGPENRFRGFARVATNERGEFRFESIKPGSVSDGGGQGQAPHLLVSVFMRGLLTRLVTRIYFPSDPRNASDLVLGLVPAERRNTLIARAASDEVGSYTWNVVLQGPEETVFFAC